MPNRLLACALAALVTLSMPGHAGLEETASKSNVVRHTIQSFDLTSSRLPSDVACAALSSVFVESGFDIKVANKDAGSLA